MENNSQAIEIKGIVRNQTKIGVQDGQCDDLVNLRFKDGSWRVADDGKQVYQMPSGTTYSQLYVHTNVYHHLLGVSNDKLYWFANIEADGETFTNLDNPVEICDVQGDVTIVQNGHLLTILSNESTQNNYFVFSYLCFLTEQNKYEKLNINSNGLQTDRTLYPFGNVHMNLICEHIEGEEYKVIKEDAGKIVFDGSGNIKASLSGALINEENNIDPKSIWHASMIEAHKNALENNKFTRPFLAIVAIKLYDDSYAYTSQPIFLYPREKYTSKKYVFNGKEDIRVGDAHFQFLGYEVTDKDDNYGEEDVYYKAEVRKMAYYGTGSDLKRVINAKMPVFSSGASFYARGKSSAFDSTVNHNTYNPIYLTSSVIGSDICLTVGNIESIVNNSDIFKGLSVFITKEIDIYDMSELGYKNGKLHIHVDKKEDGDYWSSAANVCYEPYFRKNEEIIQDLIHSPFYLLKDISTQELVRLSNSSMKLDLPHGILKNIIYQDRLDSVSMDRKTYSPKTMFSYNGKLHISNYTTKQFSGYPIDCFQLNNHSVKLSKGNFAIGGVLPDMVEGEDVQFPKQRYFFAEENFSHADENSIDKYILAARQYGTCFASISVKMQTQMGECQVVRYIAPYNSNSVNASGSALDEEPFNYGDHANFIEDLSPLLVYPDIRAKEIDIKIIYFREGFIIKRDKKFLLESLPYLNMAYYIDPDLEPIRVSTWSYKSMLYDQFLSGDIDDFIPYKEKNISEYFPNAIKVSKVNNPFYFPYETTYQVGSLEIIALMSNAVAIGTGQTGAAPLYVFCKDGIYALLVDSTGEMTYANARIVARDVCNNAKSVTPIDNGVVFTTDRGLMSIAGSEVVEIGSAAEGDVFDITDTSDKAKKIMFNAFTMQPLAEFPEGLIGNTDFLTYLKGAIINYNHNERELMVSNPDKDYTYVMDRNGNWSRRAFTAKEYVNNYPTSYRIDNAGNFYKVDTDDNDTNQVYLLSNVIKLGTIAFKKAYRLIVRGYFEANSVAYGKINGVPVKVVGSFIDRMKNGEGLHMTYITQYGQPMWVDTNNNNYVLNGQIQILDKETNEDITNSVVQVNLGQYFRVIKSYESIGCYIFGSYDGRQWSLLGGNEKGGKFTDIGCKISHTDIRFLRVCLAGKLSKNSRIDYIEVSLDGSMLNGKLR